MRGSRGFTLVELIIVIVLSGIIFGIVAVFIQGPIDAYFAQARRAELTDAAEMSLRRIARDIRRAVPNSVRVGGGGTAIEMLNVADGGRYRLRPGPGVAAADFRLQFEIADPQFNIVGPFTSAGPTTGVRLVVYNLGIAGANAYAGDAVITPAGTTVTIAPGVGGEHAVTLSPGHQFAFESPRQRIFLVDQAVSYVCGAGALRRDAGYAFGSAQPTSTAAGQIVADQVASCTFQYDPGTATRSALVTMRITLSSDGESVTLLHQVHVDNAP
ncbi:MAG: prepilin-type N-terminal cleavage/methylation domain-containing protein [Xanthomonadaceae bacterium]|nr:prepilin-type N-terminal cleavage/methylation domain-containing protein [Xanthomonadaceae bacterium]